MNKYPTDFVCSVLPFEDEDIENLLSQSNKDVSSTIDLLKLREVNATNALQILRNKIEKLIQEKEVNLLPFNKNDTGINSMYCLTACKLKEEIKELEELL